MYIFVDESGIHRPTGYSVYVFVLVEPEKLSEFQTKVQEAEVFLNQSYFHWSESSWPLKIKFSNLINNLSFTFCFVVFQNPIGRNDQKLYQAAKEVLTNIQVTKLYLDGSKPRWYISQLKKFLREQNIDVRGFYVVPDSRVPGLRVADFLAGLIRSYSDNPLQKNVQEMYQKFLIKIKPP